MTRDEFMTSTINLQSYYNKKLNEVQLQYWFQELEVYDVERYKKAIGELVVKSKTFPSLSEMLEKIRKVGRKEEQTIQEVEQVKCETCHGSGLVKYYKKQGNTDYEYLCKCYCKNGERIDLPIKKYEEVFFYRKPPIEEKIPNVEYDVSQINF